MYVYRSIGKRIITEEEVNNGFKVTKGGYAMHLPPGENVAQPFKEIGFNKPMAIFLRHVYVGTEVSSKFPPDLLVTSATKSLQTFQKKPPAVNFIAENIEKSKHLSGSSAMEDGTPLVFYTPSLIDENMDVTVELKLDRLKDIVGPIKKCFKSLAGIPIFSGETAAISTAFTAAGIATGLIESILKKLFKGQTLLSATLPIYFEMGGSGIPEEGWYILTEKKIDLQNYYIDENGWVVKNGNPEKFLESEYPYVVISVDGREYDSYKNFIPTAVSSILLEKFYKSKEENLFDFSNEIVQAVTLYSDMSYKDKAMDEWKKRESLKKDSPEWKKSNEKLIAYIKNISNTEIQTLANNQITDRQ